jgi:hypothetical protein
VTAKNIYRLERVRTLRVRDQYHVLAESEADALLDAPNSPRDFGVDAVEAVETEVITDYGWQVIGNYPLKEGG